MKRIPFRIPSPRLVSLRRGGYLAVVTAAAIAIVLFLNLIVGQLPTHLKELDLSDNQLYEISDTSRDFLAGLEQDVEVVVLAEEDATDPRILKFLDRYAALSSHLTVTEVDPVAHPTQAAAYEANADSLVVVCAETGRQEVIPYSDIITYSYSMFSSTEDSFDAEGQLTSAIRSVTGGSEKYLYTLSGHGESELSAPISQAMEKAGFTMATVTPLLTGTIPEDCDLLLVNGPTADLSQEEYTLLEDYLSGGGQMVFLCSDSEENFPNWSALLESYGLTLVDGYIADEERYYPQFGSLFAIAGAISTGTEVTQGMSEQDLTLLTNSRGFTQQEDTDAVITPVLTTSSHASAVTLDGQEVPGTYLLAAVSERAGTDGATGRLTVLGSNSLIDGDILSSYPNLVNETLFLNLLTAGFEDGSNLSIPAKSLAVTYNTIPNPGLWSALYLVVLPLVILVTGLIVWWKRRRQ